MSILSIFNVLFLELKCSSKKRRRVEGTLLIFLARIFYPSRWLGVTAVAVRLYAISPRPEFQNCGLFTSILNAK
ncbi:hypothetical protein LV92_02588 [Arenibacter echinorum]|uniref:Uncharacterized protein n=1 Tax=Arenibacter echinorum TaxID=440515 RepID=A0A327RCP7_9FLAO|nr:hypothetical protein LV92_02588 [Arenibacter echinorum]